MTTTTTAELQLATTWSQIPDHAVEPNGQSLLVGCRESGNLYCGQETREIEEIQNCSALANVMDRDFSSSSSKRSNCNSNKLKNLYKCTWISLTRPAMLTRGCILVSDTYRRWGRGRGAASGHIETYTHKYASTYPHSYTVYIRKDNGATKPTFLPPPTKRDANASMTQRMLIYIEVSGFYLRLLWHVASGTLWILQLDVGRRTSDIGRLDVWTLKLRF